MTTDNRPPGPTSEPFTGRRSLQGGYRPEIDGLRAIAVISVILFHSGIRLVGGGYVGVDVFFVISGFLITQFIDLRVTTGRFSILEFYERRVRRIVPALTIVLCATSVAAYLLLLPSDLKAFAKSLLATTLFLSNVEFWNQSGYFDAPSVGKPLLHTWSLAVEEQFYIVFPVFMAAAASRLTRRVWCWIVVLLAAGSLALSAWAVVYYPSAAFFLSPTRAWELLLGSLLALNAFPAIRSRPINNMMATVGLILILASVFLYTADTPFPGVFAVPPCLGTALIISSEYSGPGTTAIGRLLSVRPFVAVGLISYSAYLWHWPMIAFARYVLVRPFTGLERVSIILACIAVSAASWKIIERPFRRQSAVCSRQRLFAGTAATAGAFVGLAAVAYIGGGLPYRITAQAALYDAGANDVSPDQHRCLSTMTAERISASDFCTLGPKGGPRFIVWGNSHAGAVMPVIKHLANQMDIPGWFAAQPACPPLLGVRRAADKSSRCKMFNDAVFAQIRESDIPAIILGNR